MKKLICIVLPLAVLFAFGCKKKDKASETPAVAPTPSPLPSVSTTALDSLTYSSVVTGGNISSEGTSAITAVGVCWDINPAPTTLKPHSVNGAGTGTFRQKITGLVPGTKYYIRAYATNGSGTAYGSELTCTPPADWNLVKSGLPSGAVFSSVNGTLVLATSSTITRSSDGGSTWTDVTSGLSLTGINGIIAFGSKLFVYGSDGVYSSTNAGTNWTSNGAPGSGVKSVVLKGTDLFVSAYDEQVYRSTDNGANWTLASSGISPTVSIYRMVTDGTDLYVSASDGIYKSSNDGASWSAVNNGLPAWPYANPNLQFAVGSTIYACATNVGGGGNTYFKTNNGGSNWSYVTGFPSYTFYGSIYAPNRGKIFVSKSQSGVGILDPTTGVINYYSVGIDTSYGYQISEAGADVYIFSYGSLYKFAH